MSLTVSGLGAWPGEDPLAAHQAILGALADPPTGVAGLPHVAVLPARGPWAAPLGRTLAMLEDLPASLEPHGWRLGTSPSAELVRAARTLAGDVESLALAAAGYDGALAVPVLGPLSLAASTWLPVGERVIDDPRAWGDLAASLGLGVARHLETVASALAGTRAAATALVRAPAGDAAPDAPDTPDLPQPPLDTVLLHEPFLADVLAGRVSTFVGSGRLRPPESGPVLAALTALVAQWSPHPTVMVVPGDAAAITLAAAARPSALALDLTRLGEAAWEALAEAVEEGVRVWATSVPHRGEESADAGAAARAVLAPWRALGLSTDDLDLTLTARPGLGLLAPSAARRTLEETGRTATALAELLA